MIDGKDFVVVYDSNLHEGRVPALMVPLGRRERFALKVLGKEQTLPDEARDMYRKKILLRCYEDRGDDDVADRILDNWGL